MSRIKYYFKRLFGMDYKSMFNSINEIHNRSKKNKLIIFLDIVICSIKYQSGYMDYKIFYFENLKGYQRKTFVTRGVNNSYIKKMNNSDYYETFNNKVLFNQKFEKFLKRDYLYLKSNLEEFVKFTNKHKVILVKPIDMQCGKGIKKIEINDKSNIKNIYMKLMRNKQTLVEEYVLQSKEMNKLYPYSVNTLRFVTATINNKTTILFRVIRIGNNNNVVDNYNSGGMFSVINEKGIISKPAIDKSGNVYEIHPMTKTEICGFSIPFFKEAEKMVKEACKVIPEVGYVGWDIAITDKGPLMIEGNELPGYDLYQSKIHLNEDSTGVKPLFDKVIYSKK